MTAARVMDHLQGLRSTGSGRWIACCPAHEDRKPSLAVRETDDGRLLLHCFAGCNVHEVVSSLGLELSDLFPPPGDDSTRRANARQPFSAADALRCCAYDAVIVSVIASGLAQGDALDQEFRDQLLTSAARLLEATRVANV
jgi:hypothetical protein